jgi:hypothetical protein
MDAQFRDWSIANMGGTISSPPSRLPVAESAIYYNICIFFVQRFEKGYMPDDIAVVDDEPAVVIEEEQLLA